MKVLVEPKPIPRDRCRPELRELVISMLAVDPALRPSALDILETEWLVKCDRTELHATVQDTLTKLLSTVRSSLLLQPSLADPARRSAARFSRFERLAPRIPAD
jgi:serine/threonine protein kinase